MNFQERKKKILAALHDAESLSVFQLAGILSTSPATIRRDLHEIAQSGLLIRTHGGAIKPDHSTLTAFADKATSNNAIKQKIAERAASYVRDGETIFLDCGSTVFQMCRFLKTRNNLRIITNSLPVLAELVDSPGITINLIGGEVDKARKAVHGEMAIRHADTYHAHKSFIGVDGVSAENGLTAHSEVEAGITKAFIRNAAQTYLLCDASKIGKDSYIKFAPLTDIKCLITSEMDGEQKSRFKESGLVDIVVV